VTRELPLTVLAWEGPQARAYLVRMRRAGMRPRRIVRLVRDRFGPRGPVAQNPAVLAVGARLQDRSHNHHPYRIRRDRPELVGAVATAMATAVPDAAPIIDEMFDGFDYGGYADRVETVGMSGYGDEAVLDALAASAGESVLFTGGGILPPAVFETGASLVHVHTGLLPHVRGADVLLWSMLVRGRPGVSAFVMTPGLDDGDVLATREIPELRIDLPGSERPDDDLLYRAVFSFVDPLLRAELLVDGVLEPWAGERPLAGEPQDLTTGVTYHFMHPVVRTRALGRLFVSGERAEPSGGPAPDPARYDRYYARASVVAPLRFAFDASRAETPLRTLGLRNRQRDYGRLADRPDLRAAHRAMNEQLSLQARTWPSYDYGEGYHYQSSDELGVTGLRDTTGRVEAFGLRDLVAGRDALEIGCNAGFLSLAIAPAARRVVAFELNPYLIEIARIGARTLGVDNVEFLVSSFEDFDTDERFDDVLSFANHHTYDGNTHQSLDEYFARCRHLLRPGGRLIFESHPPALEGAAFGRTVEIIERYFDLERSEIHRYGTFLDQDRRFLVGTRIDR
jgi:SAM-dependent methyltransferase